MSGEFGEKVLPTEEWGSILIGQWEYEADLGANYWKGIVQYNSDKSYIKKLSCTQRVGEETHKSGGTVRGDWVLKGNTWLEILEECNISPDIGLCDLFRDTTFYGMVDSDLWNYRVVYFNNSRIEVRAEHLSGEGEKFYRFNRKD